MQLGLTYELNLDLLIVKRSVYGVLDLLGDIGGLAGSLKSLFFSLTIILQYKAAIAYVSHHTFLTKHTDENEGVEIQNVSQVQP